MPIMQKDRTVLPLMLAAIVFAGCSTDQIVGTPQLPAGLTDPSAIKSAQGALEAYRGTQSAFAHAFARYVGQSALISDEMASSRLGDLLDPTIQDDQADQLVLPQGVDNAGTDDLFNHLAIARSQAQETINLIQKYAPDSLTPLATAYTLEGYTDVLLNEFYCSGVPLSTIDFNGNYTPGPATPSSGVYQHAIALFDSALAIPGNATSAVIYLALVGKARALLEVGDFDQAAQTAASVPDAFSDSIPFQSQDETNVFYFESGNSYPVSNVEGGNGLDYVSSNDPRAATTDVGNVDGMEHYRVARFAQFSMSGPVLVPVVLASGIEARLDQAEAALHDNPNDTTSHGSGWLGILNHLRETAMSPALPDTTDPGSPAARVNLLFRERAFWLFVTGHRQGDMRRLIRLWGRDESTVYPVGQYDAGMGSFGTDVTAPIPPNETLYNPNFHGCLDRNP
ncbi:MAG: RagB/SusD family nutrient uptake outer membrane protein [Gemmatimonadaceae bacterium]